RYVHSEVAPIADTFRLSMYPFYLSSFFFFNDTATPKISTLSLHDALPISIGVLLTESTTRPPMPEWLALTTPAVRAGFKRKMSRSEEHTSELQSRFDLVCRLLLEKKKTT